MSLALKMIRQLQQQYLTNLEQIFTTLREHNADSHCIYSRAL